MDVVGAPVHNRFANIPYQCYAETVGADGSVRNPCYVCHTKARRPNWIDDQDLQLERTLPRGARQNPWTNLFERGPEPSPDVEALAAWVRQDNYHDEDGGVALATALIDPPPGWDADGDGRWAGAVPDVGFHTDEAGWDRDARGELTGWRAYVAAPLPGAFLPVNGGAGDFFIRLPEPFRQDEHGQESLEVYAANLAILEALIRGDDARKDGDPLRYVGAARDIAQAVPGLMPEGTELLHTVRYLDVDEAGQPVLATRMREVRVMRKVSFLSYNELRERGIDERQEDKDWPDRRPKFFGDAERGLSNGLGWRVQGFIEDASGALRPQTVEETTWCMGCHSGVGATTDATFSLARRLAWGHPSTTEALTADPVREDGLGEYALYLRENRAWDDLGTLPAALDGDAEAPITGGLAGLLPSAERVWLLNARLREVMRAQSYALGREPVRAPPGALIERAGEDEPTGVVEPVSAGRLASPYSSGSR